MLRVTIVGTGQRGLEWGREIARSSSWTLVAVADIQSERAHRAAVALGLSESDAFAGVADAVDARPTDAVIVATPPGEHASSCEEALGRGLGVLVEKPFTLDLTTATRLVQRAQRDQLPLLVGQTYRYLRSQRAVRRLVEQGALGDVRLVDCRCYRTTRGRQEWVRQLRHGVLWELGVHHLDALRCTLEREPSAVLADVRDSDDEHGGTAQVLLRFEDGVQGHYSVTYDSVGHERFENGQEFYERIVGERATLHVFHRWLVLFEPGRLPRPIRRGPRAVSEDAMLLSQLERALRLGEEPDASGRDNLGTMALLEAASRSADGGRWVNPQDLFAVHG
jgi:predicted dehydrogenase